MIGAAAAYMSGLFFASFFTEGSDFLLLAVSIPMFFMICVAILKFRCGTILMLLISFGAGLGAYRYHTENVYDNIMKYEGQTCSYSGKIIAQKEHASARCTYTLDGTINGETHARITFYADSYDVSIGDIMVLENCKLEAPESDYLFDSAEYYKSDNIFLESNHAEIVEIEHKNNNKLSNALRRFREDMSLRLVREIGIEDGAFLSGLLFGETAGIEYSERTLLYRSGIGHVMAVSGLHISIIAALIMFLMNSVGANKYVSFAAMNVFLVLMIIMVEYPISAVRAAIMLDIMYSARLFRRQKDALNSLSLAVIILCLYNPYVIHDAGFLLSISGTFGIAVLGPYMVKSLDQGRLYKKFMSAFAVMLLVSLVIMPVNLYYFDEVSLVSPFTNILIVPLCITAMICGLIYVITFGHTSVLLISRGCIDLVRILTDKIGRIGNTHLSAGDERYFKIALICAVFVIMVYALLRSRRGIAVGISLSVILFFSSVNYCERSAYSELRIAFLGKGNNCTAAAVIDGEAYIFDMNGNYKSPQYVRKYLYGMGIDNVYMLYLNTREPSQYAAYLDNLSLMKIENIVTANQTPTVDSTSAEGQTVTIQGNGFTLEYVNNRLIIKRGNMIVTTMAASEFEGVDSNLTVLYGSKNDYKDESGIINYSDMNNFEIIIPPESEKIRLRRL